MNLIELIDRQPKYKLIILAIIIVMVIGIADYLTGAEIASAIFYLLPISIAAWFINRTTAISLSIVSSIIWIIADKMTRSYDMHPLIHLWNFIASFGIFLIFSFILAELKGSLIKERLLSRTDQLSNLLNRRGFIELAGAELKRMRRFGHPFTLAYIDIDNFKAVNDTFGHRIGDMLLHSVAATMQNNIRETDMAGRLGGDEFAIMMPETAYEPSMILVGRLQIQLLDVMQKNAYPVTFSIGVVTFYEPPISVDAMLNKVDNVMYSVKNSGKNNIRHEVFGKNIG